MWPSRTGQSPTRRERSLKNGQNSSPRNRIHGRRRAAGRCNRRHDFQHQQGHPHDPSGRSLHRPARREFRWQCLRLAGDRKRSRRSASGFTRRGPKTRRIGSRPPCRKQPHRPHQSRCSVARKTRSQSSGHHWQQRKNQHQGVRGRCAGQQIQSGQDPGKSEQPHRRATFHSFGKFQRQGGCVGGRHEPSGRNRSASGTHQTGLRDHYQYRHRAY